MAQIGEVTIFDESEDGCPDQEAEEAGGKIVFSIVPVVPWHFVQLECSCLCLCPRVGDGELSIVLSPVGRPLVVNTIFSYSLDDCH